MGIEDWSTTASENDTADASINWQENQAPSTVNNSARAMMAATRVWYDDYEWRDWGHTVTYATTTTFTVATDVTAIYTAGRPIRCEDSSTLYGYVASSSYGAPNTTVTVTLDSGSLSVSLSSVALGIDPTYKSIPEAAIILSGAIVSTLDNTVTPVTVANTITETTVYSYTIKGNTISSTNKKLLKLKIMGDYINNTASPEAPTILIKLGSTTVIDYDTVTSNDTSRRAVFIEAILYNVGASDSEMYGVVWFSSPGTVSSATSNTAQVYTLAECALARSIGEDVTADKSLVVTFQHSVADANIEFVMRYANVTLE